METFFPSMKTSPSVAVRTPNRTCATSVFPAPTRPVSPRTSPSNKVRETSRKDPGQLELVELENAAAALADGNIPGGGLQLAADHQRDDGRRICGADGKRPHRDAVAQHRNPIADLLDLLQPMRDVDNADPTFLEVRNRPEQRIGFAAAQRRRRLVHDEDFGVFRQSQGDFQHLLLRHREIADLGLEIDAKIDASQRRLGARKSVFPADQLAFPGKAARSTGFPRR